MNRYKQSLTLILPVYRGGVLFARCLRSIKLCEDVFDRIVISLNGDSSGDDARQLSESGINEEKLIVYKTKTDLSPVCHFIWLCNQLKLQMHQYDRVMLMAHDDELIPDQVRRWRAEYPSYGKRTAWIGDYQLIDDLLGSEESGLCAAASVSKEGHVKPITLIDWLAHNEKDPRHYVFTNMTGISVPFSVLQSVVNFWRLTFAKIGARFEYMLVSHKSIEGIMGVNPPMVIIHLHESQSGRNVPSIEYSKDELRYYIWLLINAKSLRELIWVFQSRWGWSGIRQTIMSIIFHVIRKLKATGT